MGPMTKKPAKWRAAVREEEDGDNDDMQDMPAVMEDMDESEDEEESSGVESSGSIEDSEEDDINTDEEIYEEDEEEFDDDEEGDDDDDDDEEGEDDDDEEDDEDEDDEDEDEEEEEGDGKHRKTAKKKHEHDEEAEDDDEEAPMDPIQKRGYIGKKPLYEGAVARVEDSSSEEEIEGFRKNTVGNIPLEWYNDEDHIGYDLDGNRISRKQRRDQLDELIARMDDPDYWRTIRDERNDREKKMTDEEIEILRRIQSARFPDPAFDPHPEYVDYFDYPDGIHPVSSTHEPKRRFVPSKWEARKVNRLVRLIRAGQLDPKPKPKPDTYLIWNDDDEAMHSKYGATSMPAPKLKLPGHALSYNPPDEYLPTQEQREAWENRNPKARAPFIPTKYKSLREVPAYDNFVRERFERCMDLYLAPRAFNTREEIDPESLVPKLPSPKELAPFPTHQAAVLRGHIGPVLAISISPAPGNWLASGGKDGSLRIWEMRNFKCRFSFMFPGPVDFVVWCPNPAMHYLIVGSESFIYVIIPPGGSEDQVAATEELMREHAEGMASIEPDSQEISNVRLGGAWMKPDAVPAIANSKSAHAAAKKRVELAAEGNTATHAKPSKGSSTNNDGSSGNNETPENIEAVRKAVQQGAEILDNSRDLRFVCAIKLRKALKWLAFHGKGDYFASVIDDNTNSIAIHQLSKARSQNPFRNLQGLVQCVEFHPVKPFLFVATQTSVRVYNLVKHELTMKCLSGMKWISSLNVHRSGDHFLIGSYDKKVAWFDMDLGTTPYKTLRYHQKAVRDVKYHPRYPLFATCSDDKTVQVFHGMIYDDLSQNALIVPLKKLAGHGQRGEEKGPLVLAWHPLMPWLVTAGADGMIQVVVNLN